MSNYQDGKFYIIKSLETDDVYIGSTCSSLLKRMCSHKSEYKRLLKGEKFNKKTSHQVLKYADAFIELIEVFPCNSKQELLKREGEIIRTTPHCVNDKIAGRTDKEWLEDNKEHVQLRTIEYKKKNRDRINTNFRLWYSKNKERLNSKHIKKEVCPLCNVELTIKTRVNHNKTEHPEMLIQRIHDHNKKYRDNHKQELKVIKSAKISCLICSKMVSNSNMSRHMKNIHPPPSSSI